MGDIITQPISDYTEFNSIKGYIAVTWGNQRYVVNAKKEADYVTGKISLTDLVAFAKQKAYV
jgi:hypothetical protein